VKGGALRDISAGFLTLRSRLFDGSGCWKEAVQVRPVHEGEVSRGIAPSREEEAVGLFEWWWAPEWDLRWLFCFVSRGGLRLFSVRGVGQVGP
jgi:hypothetical protein